MPFSQRFLPFSICGLLTALTLFSGCGTSERAPKPNVKTETPVAAEPPAEKKPVKIDGPFKLGDMIEPFDPPALEELESQVEWTDSPVVDAMAELRKVKETEPALVSVDEALAMRNDSSEANKKILSA